MPLANDPGTDALLSFSLFPKSSARNIARTTRTDSDGRAAIAAHGDDNTLAIQGRRINQWVETVGKPELLASVGIERAQPARNTDNQFLASVGLDQHWHAP